MLGIASARCFADALLLSEVSMKLGYISHFARFRAHRLVIVADLRGVPQGIAPACRHDGTATPSRHLLEDVAQYCFCATSRQAVAKLFPERSRLRRGNDSLDILNVKTGILCDEHAMRALLTLPSRNLLSTPFVPPMERLVLPSNSHAFYFSKIPRKSV